MSNKLINNLNRVSRVFQPINTISKNATIDKKIPGNSYNVMIDVGIIKQVNPGMYALLPLGMRSLQKLINLVDKEMEKVGAQKLLLPILTSASLWEKSGRLVQAGSELFTLSDRNNKRFILGPTYEEAISDLISNISPLSPTKLPLRLYQISSKLRDEMKPRLGLLRSREFIMKDLYTFDCDEDSAKITYETIYEAYKNIFERIGIKYLKALGNTGLIGGKLSHEYHFLTDMGEDKVLTCSSCDYSINATISNNSTCPECKGALSEHSAVEVGHTFLLDTKYSKPLEATYLDSNRKKLPLVMGCFGLGLTRILSTAVEILSSNRDLRWPTNLAPYTVCIIPPKDGSKEASATQYVEPIYEMLEDLNLDVIIDDRTRYTIGKRLVDVRKVGYPYAVVIGRTAVESTPLFEVHDINSGTHEKVNMECITDYFRKMNNEEKLMLTSSLM